MDKTNIMVDFRIIGDVFNLDVITNKLLIKPSYYWLKGDRNKNNIRKYSCWAISTGYEESLDINNQLNKIIELIKTKKQELKELKNKHELDYRFDIIINIENEEKPAIYLNIDIIDFAHEIKAEFDIDLYIL
jgi:hypothetical protein